MNPFTAVYHELLFRPLFNLGMGLTSVLLDHSVGLGVVAVTVLVRCLLLPPALRQARHMQANQSKMAALKTQLAKINERYKDNAAKKAEETMALYRRAGINPASGCLPLLLQLPILIALYRVFLVGLSPEMFTHLYSFVDQPQSLALSFFGINLSTPSFILAALAGVSQFVLMRRVTPASAPDGGNEASAQMMASMQKNMAYIFPVMTVFISLQLPAALALYWVASTIFGIVQQAFFKKYLNITPNIAV